MVVKFKYNIPNNLQHLISGTVNNYVLNYVYGLLDEGLLGELRHCSLYLICEYENINNSDIWTNPIAVIGHNDIEAMEIYVRETKKENGSILCEIVNRCDNLKVEQCD